MKRVIWGSLFLGFAVLIIILLLAALGKPVSDLIFSILTGAMAVCIISAIVVQRKRYIENKLKNN